MTRLLAGLLLLLLLLLLLAAPAHAQLFARNTLDRSYCSVSAPRQTVVYIDDTAMVAGDTGWAASLSGRLRASLVHGEPVALVRLSPATGQSKEVWQACWPGVTAAERTALASRTSFFGGDPTTDIDRQVQLFARDFGQALSALYAAARRPAGDAAIDPAHPPARDILRALASDGSRFAQSRTVVRAILYSTLVENSSLGSALHPLAAAPTYGRQLATTFRNGVFYLFGLGEGLADPTATDTVRAFWTAALRSMQGAVEAIGAGLNLPNVYPVNLSLDTTQLIAGGQTLDGRMALLTDADGTLVDSLLSVPRLENGTAALTGTYTCRGPTCRLEATAEGGLVTSSPEAETIDLAGNPTEGLAGQIGVRGEASFPLRTVP